MNARTRVIIVEPWLSGHHGIWLRWIAAGLLTKGWSVEICSLRVSAREPIFLLLQEQMPDAALHLLDLDLPKEKSAGAIAIYRRDFRHWWLMRRLLEQVKKLSPSDRVVLPYMDYCLNTIGAIGSPFRNVPWMGISMRPRFHHREMGIKGPEQGLASLRERSFTRMLKASQLLRCLSLDESLVDFVRKKHPRLGAKIAHLPDPIEQVARIDRQPAREQLGISSGALVVLVFGSMDRRKGVQFLLPALARFPGLKPVHALLVGRQDAFLRSLLQSSDAKVLAEEGRLHVLDKWIDDTEEALTFASADMVWLGYEGHWQSSGVQIQAGRAGLPVIAGDEGIIGWFTQNNDCGLTVTVTDVSAVAAAIQKLSDSQSLRARLGGQGRISVEGHTTAMAVDLIDSALLAGERL